MPSVAEAVRRIAKLQIRVVAVAPPSDRYAGYRDDPVGFCKDVLRIELVPLQIESIESLAKPPYRTLTPSANEQGKTLLGAATAIWFFCTRRPAIVVTTAPKLEQVRDLLWKEIRRLARRLPERLPFTGPKALRVERSAEDFMTGTTARDLTSFQGHHG